MITPKLAVPKGRAGIGELGMVQRVVELDAEGEFRVLAQAADAARLPSEKSVFTWPGPFMMLSPALP